MTNHKTLIDVTASLKRSCLCLEKKRYTKNRSVCKKWRDIGLVWELHAPADQLLVSNSIERHNLIAILSSSTLNGNSTMLFNSVYHFLYSYRDLAFNARESLATISR